MIMVLKALLTYLVQPALWVAIATVIYLYFRRLKLERKQFRIAIEKDFYEGRTFLKTGLLLGGIGTLLTFILGLTLTTKMVYAYEAVTIVSLLLGGGAFSFYAILLTGGVALYLNPGQSGSIMASAFLVLAILYLLGRLFLASSKQVAHFFPLVKNGQRGRRVATYRWREMAVAPILVLIPGNEIQGIFAWWPVINLGQSSYSLFFLPLLVTAGMQILKQDSKEALIFYQKQTEVLLLLTVVVAIMALIWPVSAPYGLGFMGLVSIISWLLERRKDHQANNWYVETTEGVRVLAVRKDTPAAKMGLQAGDIILECNKVPVSNEKNLYAALQENSAYCRLRVKTYAGDLRAVGSAIYADSPHEIGLVLFQDEF